MSAGYKGHIERVADVDGQPCFKAQITYNGTPMLHRHFWGTREQCVDQAQAWIRLMLREVAAA